MSELTENQQKVLTAIRNGADTNDNIAEKSGVAKGSITAVVNSLIKRELVAKSDEGRYIPVDLEQDGTSADVVVIGAAAPVQKTGVTVLIPYLKDEAAGEELKYALRTWEKHFTEEFNVVVIGDKEDWFSPEITHIPHEPHLIKEVCNCPSPSLIRNPQADVTHKIFTAIASGIISDDFILSNDDIYLLGKTFLEDIKTLKAFGTLDKSGEEGGLYNQNAKRTAKALLANNLPTHRYGTHTPMLLNAEKLAQVIEKYGALDNAFLLTSLYFNETHPDARPIQVDGTKTDPILASVYRSNVEDHLLKSIFAQRKFMNCNSKGWISVKAHLAIAFPEPSRFEK